MSEGQPDLTLQPLITVGLPRQKIRVSVPGSIDLKDWEGKLDLSRRLVLVINPIKPGLGVGRY